MMRLLSPTTAGMPEPVGAGLPALLRQPTNQRGQARAYAPRDH
jgi:hypothetical protein